MTQRKLFVYGIDTRCRLSDVIDLFEQYGRILRVECPPPRDRNAHVMFVFIEYCYGRDAEIAIRSLDGISFYNNYLKVEFAKADPTAVPSYQVSAGSHSKYRRSPSPHSFNRASPHPSSFSSSSSSSVPPYRESVERSFSRERMHSNDRNYTAASTVERKLLRDEMELRNDQQSYVDDVQSYSSPSISSSIKSKGNDSFVHEKANTGVSVTGEEPML